METKSRAVPLVVVAGFLGRVVWVVVVVVAVVVVGIGLNRTFYFEPTTEALDSAETGVRLIADWSLVLLAAVALAWWGGAPRWALVAVLTVPTLCGGLTWVWYGTLIPHLAYLGAAPLAGIGALGALIQRWRRS